MEKSSLQELEIEQLTSVIHGLLRQNSYTFLEVLEEASISAIKTAFRDVAKQILAPDDPDVTLTNLVADLAKKANGQRWVEFFDILLGKIQFFREIRMKIVDLTNFFVGSLILLLRRIHAIHSVIMDAIDTANNAR